jgi:hypothetical protein
VNAEPTNPVRPPPALVDGTPCEVGDWVQIVALHVWATDGSPETLRLYNRSALRPQRVAGIGRNGDVWVELHVNDDGSPARRSGRHTLCVLPGELARVGRSAGVSVCVVDEPRGRGAQPCN